MVAGSSLSSMSSGGAPEVEPATPPWQYVQSRSHPFAWQSSQATPLEPPARDGPWQVRQSVSVCSLVARPCTAGSSQPAGW
jgi:hypothetical protein